MKISIITVCYNSEKYIRTAIDSVLSQTYKEIEYIIVDGQSSDRTIEIINSYGNKITKFISEPDKGLYDAMNKGFKLATGDYLAVLNSDDFYVDENVVFSVVEELKEKKTESIFADLIYVENENPQKQVRYWKTKPFRKDSFGKGWHPPHPTFFVKREVYEKYGYFNLNFKLAADFELMLRFLEKNKISSTYLSKPLIKMRLGGTTNKNFKNIFNQNIECFKAFKVNKLRVSLLYPFFRLLPKLTQYFK